MCAKQLNPLPYRRLRLMANGIWDEVKKEFYPFISSVSSATITGKKGIMYYVKFVSISAQNTGDHAVAYSSVKVTQLGVARYLLQLLILVSAAATSIPSSGTISHDAHILCDVRKQRIYYKEVQCCKVTLQIIL